MFSEYVPAPGTGGRPTWSGADIRRFAEEGAARRWVSRIQGGVAGPGETERAAEHLASLASGRCAQMNGNPAIAGDRRGGLRKRRAGADESAARWGEQKPGCSAGCSSKKSQA